MGTHHLYARLRRKLSLRQLRMGRVMLHHQPSAQFSRHASQMGAALHPMDQPSLRAVADTDQEFLLNLYRASHCQTYESMLHLPKDTIRALLEMQLRAQATSYHQRFPDALFQIICDADGCPVGKLTVARNQLGLHLLDIALLPTHRDRGWGTALIGMLQRQAAATNIPLRLRAVHGNRALQLYLRMGFVVTAEHELDVCMTWISPAIPVATHLQPID